MTAPGVGYSVGSTSLLERIARPYLTMTGPQLRATSLKASWNPGGTYDTAFLVPGPGTVSMSPETEELVYVGDIAAIYKGKSGFLLTLSVKHADGNDLRIWIQNSLASVAPGGPQLWDRLANGSITNGMIIFALGKFARQTTSGTLVYYSMPTVDPRRVWIVDTKQAEALLDSQS